MIARVLCVIAEFNPTGIDRVGFWIDVNQNRTGTGQLDCPHRRDRSMCGGNDLIAPAYVAGQQCKKQRVGAGCDSQPVRCTAVG